MRIIAGEYRGLQLKSVSGQATRPTQDRVREAVFSILGNAVDGAEVLDLYAGTGAMGLEALSRGANWATFVEMSKGALDVLRANIALTRTQAATVVPLPVERGVKKLRAEKKSFSLVFMDPPYGHNLVHQTLLALSEVGIVADSAMVVAEHENRSKPPRQIGHWFMIDSRSYGDTGISIYSFMDQEI